MTVDIASLGIAIDSRQVKEAGVSLDDLATKGAKAEEATKKLSSATEVLGKVYGDLVKAYGAWKIAQHIQDMTMLAARYETMGIVMRVAGNNAGYTAVQMDEYSKALQRSGISMLQSRNSLTQLATANIDLANAAKLGRAAQDLAVVGNINSSEALGRMIYGLKSGQVEILHTLGLNVSFEASYKRMAASLGTTVEKLTEHQKVQARTNAVLTEAARYQGIYEESMTTAGKAITSLTRYWEDFKVKAGGVSLPALADGVFMLTDALKDANKELDKAGGDGGQIATAGKAFDGAFKTAIQTAAVLSANFLFVWSQIGRTVAGAAAAINAAAHLNFDGVKQIDAALREDNAAARAALDAFEKKIMGTTAVVVAAGKQTEEQRIASGAASRAQAEADEKAAKAAEEATKRAKHGDEMYKSLTASLREKIDVAKVELDHDIKLTDAQKMQAETTAKLNEIKKLHPGISTATAQALLVEAVATMKANDEKNKWIKLQTNAEARYADGIEAVQKDTQAVQDATRSMREQTAEMGLSNEALTLLRQSRVDDQIASDQRQLSILTENGVESDATAAIRAHIAALEDRKRAMSEASAATKELDAVKAQGEQWKSVEQAAHSAWGNIERDGIGSLKRIGATIKSAIWDMLYQLTVKKWIINLSASMSGTAAASSAFGATAAGASGGESLLSSASNMIGLSSLPSFGTALSNMGTMASTFTTMMGEGATMMEAGSAALAGMGSSFAAVLGPIGLGVAALGALGAFSGGSDRTASLQAQGIRGTFGPSGFSGAVQNFTGSSPTDWWGGDSPSSLDATAQAALNAQIAGLYATVGSLASSIGLDTSGLSSVSYTTQGETGKGLANEINAALAALSDALVTNVLPNVASLQQAGESLTQTFVRITQQRISWQEQLDVAAGRVTQQELDRQHQLAAVTDDVTKALMREVFAQQDAAEAAKEAAARIAGAVSSAFDVLKRSVQGQKDVVTAAYETAAARIASRIDTVNASIARLTSLSGALRSTLDTIGIGPGRAEAQAQLSAALAIARAGGVLPTAEQLQPALKAIQQPSEALFTTFADYQRDFQRTANDIAALGELTDNQTTVAQRTLDALNSEATTLRAGFDAEIARLDGILTSAQRQVDALNGISSAVVSLANAVRTFNGATATATSARPENTSISDATIYSAVTQYATAYGTGNDSLTYLYDTAVRNNVTAAQLDRAMRWAPGTANSWADSRGLPHFGAGGMHAGGLRLVGEYGPELEATGPARIWSADDTRRALAPSDNAEMISEMRALRAEFANARGELEEIKGTNKRIADITEKSDAIGPAPARATL
jgi:hypothetical protein